MQHLSKIFFAQPILSLRTGGDIGKAERPIFNPDSLRLEGWWATSYSQPETFVLLSNDVRDIISKGIVVDDYESLVPPEDLVRLKRSLEIDYQLLGRKVTTDGGRKLGKVIDFAVDDTEYLVTQLHVLPSMLKNPTGSHTIISRNQIIEINDKHIVVKDPTVSAREKRTAGAPVAA